MNRMLTCTATALLALASSRGPANEPPTAAATADAAPEPSASHEFAMLHVPRTLADWARGAMLFRGLGSFHRSITTSSPDAQHYFDQGMRLMWAFNHDEATRSFARAAELDPSCASCYWGVSLTVGPNYNLPFMVSERAKLARSALERALANAPHASAVEQELIRALAARYPTAAPLDSSSTPPILEAYATAMGKVARHNPADLDVQTLYAEALMNVHAWRLWAADGTPAPLTRQILAILESVLARNPNHPGANHYYIHAMEASPHPELALRAAERVATLMPAAGHLVHMPAHIMQRVGRYEDAADANRKAAIADGRYAQRTHPLDYYPAMYMAHNYQFLAYSAAMEGRRAESLEATDNARRVVDDQLLFEMPGLDWYLAESYAVRLRFGMWDDMLALPPPSARLTALTAGYRFGRAYALAASGRVAEARFALGELRSLVSAAPADSAAGYNSLAAVMSIAIPLVTARIATDEHRTEDAIQMLREAASAEDHLAYDEPKDWFFPVRHLLGTQLLQAGRPAEAEAVYRDDLRQNPANGWALYGLSMALRAQGRKQQAAEVTRRFEVAWRHADTSLHASAF